MSSPGRSEPLGDVVRSERDGRPAVWIRPLAVSLYRSDHLTAVDRGATVERTVMLPGVKIYLASPRGFCAGVEYAIEIVERALDRFEGKVYVRHEIVHNRHVATRLEGATNNDERRRSAGRSSEA